jgi:hypothetical protein
MIGAMVTATQLGWILMNWGGLGEGQNKVFTLLWLAVLLVFNFILGFVWAS